MSESDLPSSAESAPGKAALGSLLDWISTVDHKKIGILYICTAVFFLGLGGLEALLIRVQLLFPNNDFLSADLFNQMFTMHGTTMVFLVGMPVLVGFQNYFVPLIIRARPCFSDSTMRYQLLFWASCCISVS